MLDGIELVSALTHYHAGLSFICLSLRIAPSRSISRWKQSIQAHGVSEESSEQKPGMTDDELSSLLDTILEEDDENGDGYIDYAEFMLSQR